MAATAEKTHSLLRLETFTDAVTAVAITILVLDLKVPEISTAVRQNRFEYGFLHHHGPKFIAFAVSFFSIAAGWTVLIAEFRKATRATWPMIWLTLAYLFFTCLVPWASAFWSENFLLPQAVCIYLAVWTSIFGIGTLLQSSVRKTFFPDDELGVFASRLSVATFDLEAIQRKVA